MDCKDRKKLISTKKKISKNGYQLSAISSQHIITKLIADS